MYGPREPKTGDFATVVRKFIRQYQENKPLTVVGDGEQRRDFTHVDDITDGLIKIMSNGVSDSLYHLGRGINYSINELTSMFKNAKISYVPLRKGEGDITLANYEETFNKLNWKATRNLQEWINEQISKK